MQTSENGSRHVPGTGVLVALWAFADAIILGLPIMIVTAVSGRPVAVFLVGSALYLLFNIGACRWIETRWDDWIVGTSFEGRLERLRERERVRRVIESITNGSARAFGVAAVILSASEVIALHRLATSRLAGPKRVLAASLAPAVVYPTLCTLVGWFIYELLHV